MKMIFAMVSLMIYGMVGCSSSSDGAVLGPDSTTTSKDSSNSLLYGNFTDSRDGQIYKWVKIGNLTWMAQNLNYKVDSSWCPNNVASYCAIYGRLYQWAAALDFSSSYNDMYWSDTLPRQGVCPSGWHVPRDVEWRMLINTTSNSNPSGTVLKAHSSLWNENTGTDLFHFSALPAGAFNPYRMFSNLGNGAYFWSSTALGSSMAWIHSFTDTGISVNRLYISKTNDCSLRCVKDVQN